MSNTPVLRRHIWVKFQRKGFHAYPGAPEQVAYLSQRHRHLFKFKVMLSVTHANRDIEFHMLQSEIESWYDQKALELDNKSCEMMAEDLIAKLHEAYPTTTSFVVEVSEDGECGAIVTADYPALTAAPNFSG